MTNDYEPMIKDYLSTAELFAKCRKPEKGKPIRTFMRLFKLDDGTFVFRMTYDNVDVCTLTPDNVLTFVITKEDARKVANTLAIGMERVVPFRWYRKSTGRWKIVPMPFYYHSSEFDNQHHWTSMWETHQKYLNSESEEFFCGLQFNMETGIPINPLPDIEETLVLEKRRMWHNAIRKWKRAVRVRGKIGALDKLIKEEYATKTTHNRVHFDILRFNTDDQLDILYKCIKNNEHPTELLRLFVQGAVRDRGYYYYGGSNTCDAKEVLAHMDTILNNHSLDLRKLYGVFGEEFTNDT